MAEVVRYVNTASTAGGDGTTNATSGANRAYATLAEWESNEQADLVTAGDNHVVYCEGSTADGRTTIAGWTTGASNDIQVIGNDGQVSLVYSTSKYRIFQTPTASFQYGLSVNQSHVTVKNIQVHRGAEGGFTSIRGVYSNGAADEVYIENVGVYNNSGTRYTDSNSEGIKLDYGTGNHYVSNCAVVEFYDGIVTAFNSGSESNCNYVYNNTFYSNTVGLSSSWNSARTRNNICDSNTTDVSVSGGWHDYNFSSDATAGGSNSVTNGSVTFTSTTANAWDLHLANDTSDAAGAGADLDADTYYAITDDADGDSRHATAPDIGADEYTAGGSTYTLTADAGSYSVTGIAVNTLYNRIVTAEAGTYSYAGSNVGTLYNRALQAEAGSYGLTGLAVDLLKNYVLVGESGSYTLSGSPVNLLHNRRLVVDAGSYALTGADVTLTYSPTTTYTLTAEAGSYTLTGEAVNLLYNRTLQAEGGTYTVTGAFVTLLYSGAGAGGGPTVISGNQMLTTKQDTALPLEVIVDQSGGISGLTVLAKIRDPENSSSYLDFDDMTFKTSGWVDDTLTITDLGGGFYATTLDITAITNLPSGKSLAVEYTVSGSVNAITQHSILFLDDYLTTGKFLGLQ